MLPAINVTDEATTVVCACQRKLLTHDNPKRPIGDDDEEDDHFLGAISTRQQTQWLTELRVNDFPVTFKIDTGAKVSAISEGTFNQLQNVQMENRLYRPAMSLLTVLGQFTASLRSKHVTCKQNVLLYMFL